MPIPKNISTDHILKALLQIDKFGIPGERLSTKYVLVFNNKRYPSKYVLSIANTFANDNELEPTQFSGGEKSNKFLKRLGFTNY